jgi:phosphohistidine phosphatase
MKTVFLLRHAKSSPIARGVVDFERELTEQGSEDAKLIGEYLQAKKFPIHIVVSSPAARARETAGLVVWSAGLTIDVRYDRRVYEADPQMLLDVISELDSRNESVLLIGHNPAIGDLLRGLTGNVETMSPASLAQITCDVEKWADVTPGNCSLTSLIDVRDLPLDEGEETLTE